MDKRKELMKTILARAKEKVKATKKKPLLVLCEGWDERGLKAAEFVSKKKIARIVLLDQGGKVPGAASQYNVDVSRFEIIDIKDQKNDALKKELADVLFKAREKKGMTLEQATQLIEDENYFGCCLALAGKADGVLGSLIRPTADLMKPALQLMKKGLVNEVSVFHDKKNERIIFGTDFSLNISPTTDQLAEMGINMAEVAELYGFDAKVGMLSFSTKGSGGDTPETLAAREVVKKAKEMRPSLKIGGEYQVDAAVNPDSAKRKCPDDEYAGQINCLLFPNLTASNIAAHGYGQFSDMVFIFTIMKGMIKPVTILGRSMPADSVRDMFVATALDAMRYCAS